MEKLYMELIEMVREASFEKQFFNQTYKVINETTEKRISFHLYKQKNMRMKNTLLFIQILALKNGVIPLRYIDNVVHFGVEGQIKLLESKVAIIGLGRLGCQVAENLTRLGVGKILLIDNDKISESNLNSQHIALPEYLNLNNSAVMSMRIRDINSGIDLDEVNDLLTPSNFGTYLVDYDYVVSTNNSIETQIGLMDYAIRENKSLILGSLSGNVGTLLSVLQKEGKGVDYYQNQEMLIEAIHKDHTTLSHVAGIVAGYQTSEVAEAIIRGENKTDNNLFSIDLNSQYSTRIGGV